MRILNFAHGDLYMLGAMFTWWALMTTGLPFIPSLLIGIAIVSVIGVLIERVFLRPLGGDVLAGLVMSIGLGLVIQTSTALLGGSDLKRYSFPLQGTLSIGPTNLSMERLMITVLGIGGSVVFYLLLQRTKLGRAIRAVAQDHDAATLQGINPSTIRTIAMVLGTAIAAMGGALSGSMFGVEPFMGGGPLLFSFIVIVLGGLGSIEGTFLAGLLLGLAESFITIYIGATEAAMAGFIVLYVTLLLRPNGLLGRARLEGGYL
jgi:branched-chain amino acid transport system permease protein